MSPVLLKHPPSQPSTLPHTPPTHHTCPQLPYLWWRERWWWSHFQIGWLGLLQELMTGRCWVEDGMGRETYYNCLTLKKAYWETTWSRISLPRPHSMELQYFTLPGLFHMESMEWRVEADGFHGMADGFHGISRSFHGISRWIPYCLSQTSCHLKIPYKTHMWT